MAIVLDRWCLVRFGICWPDTPIRCGSRFKGTATTSERASTKVEGSPFRLDQIFILIALGIDIDFFHLEYRLLYVILTDAVAVLEACEPLAFVGHVAEVFIHGGCGVLQVVDCSVTLELAVKELTNIHDVFFDLDSVTSGFAIEPLAVVNIAIVHDKTSNTMAFAMPKLAIVLFMGTREIHEPVGAFHMRFVREKHAATVGVVLTPDRY